MLDGVVFCKYTCQARHLVKVCKGFQFIEGDVQREQILLLFAHLFWDLLDQVILKIENLHRLWHGPRFFDLVVGQIEAFKEIQTRKFAHLLFEEISRQVELLEVFKLGYLTDFGSLLVHKSKSHESLWILYF